MIKKGVFLVLAVLVGFVFGYTAVLTGQFSGFATLAEYPYIFDGEIVGVYGDTSEREDVLCLYEVLKKISMPKPQEAIILDATSGGKKDDVPIGNVMGDFFKSSYRAMELAGFQDSNVVFNGGSYDFHDELIIGKINRTSIDASSSPRVVSSLISGDDDYESGIFVEFKRGAVGYYYVFDESIDLSEASLSMPLKINFLGKELIINGVVGSTEFKAYVAGNTYMAVGDSISIEGKSVTLRNVGQNAVVVDVDGVQETIAKGATEEVNGMQISVIELLYRTQTEQSSAVLNIGIKSADNIKDGDVYSGGDGRCDNTASDPDCWVWVVEGLTTVSAGDIYSGNGPTIGVKSDFRMEDAGEDPMGVGECIELPNRYAEICFESLSVPNTNYQNYRIYLDDDKMFIEASGTSDGLKANNNKVTSRIELIFNSSNIDVMYKSENTMKLAGTITPTAGICTEVGEVHYDSTQGNDAVICLQGVTSSSNDMNLTFDMSGREGFVTIEGNDDLVIGLKHSTSGFNGLRKLWWGSSAKDITSKDEDHRTAYGIIIHEPDSGISGDLLELAIPSDQVEANIVIKGAEEELTLSKPDTVYPISATDIIKASNLGSTTGKNLVVVGGPNVNSLTKEFLGEWAYTPGQAVITLKKNALIIAGTTSIDTMRACNIINQYEDYKELLKGDFVIV